MLRAGVFKRDYKSDRTNALKKGRETQNKATIQNLKPHQSRALTAGTGVKFSTKKKTTKKK